MGTHGAYTLVFKIYVGRSAESFLQTISTHQRGGAVIFVFLAHFLRNLNPAVGGVQFLTATFFGEDREQILGFERLMSGRMERGQRLVGHVGLDVVPIVRNLGFRKYITLGDFGLIVRVFVHRMVMKY